MNKNNYIDNEDKDLRDIAPALSKVNMNNPFRVPENYFDEFPTLIQQITSEENPSIKIQAIEWFKLLIKPRFVIPVLSTFFIAFTGINYMNNHAGINTNAYADEISVEEQLSSIDEDAIVESLAMNTDENTANTTDENTIENYLIDDNIDESNLNNEL